jgi:hypothetical protein
LAITGYSAMLTGLSASFGGFLQHLAMLYHDVSLSFPLSPISDLTSGADEHIKGVYHVHFTSAHNASPEFLTAAIRAAAQQLFHAPAVVNMVLDSSKPPNTHHIRVELVRSESDMSMLFRFLDR